MAYVVGASSVKYLNCDGIDACTAKCAETVILVLIVEKAQAGKSVRNGDSPANTKAGYLKMEQTKISLTTLHPQSLRLFLHPCFLQSTLSCPALADPA